jgi:4'-phosphopantetheinyl transferase
VWWIALDSGDAHVRDLSLLDEDERERALGFVRAEDSTRFVAVHAALRSILGPYVGAAPGSVRIERLPCTVCGKPHGRPVVRTSSDLDLRFSLAYSRERAILVLALGREVGADIEHLDNAEGAYASAAVFLDADEQAALEREPSGDRGRTALERWTTKEALLKVTGVGLNVDPKAFSLPAGGPDGWELLAFEADDYVVNVAVRPPVAGIEIFFAGGSRPGELTRREGPR